MTYSTLRPWVNGVGGNTAILFALMVLPILVVSGFAIDASRQVSAKKHLQQATDMAALAAAHAIRSNVTETSAVAVAEAVFSENIALMHGDVSCSNQITWDGTDQTATSTGTCSLPTIFGANISGLNAMQVNAKAVAEASVTTLDLALVMDNSNSMDSAAMTSLKTGAKNLVNAVLTADDTVRVALIPYNSSVNAGSVGFTAIDREQSGPIGEADPENDGRDKLCLTERTGTEMYTDAAPESGAWIGAPTTLSRRCDITEMLPLSSDLTDLEAAIDAMDNPAIGSSGTGGHVGIAWGWYAISPEWATIWPAASEPFAYGNPDELKVVVIMTDGVFNIAYSGGETSPAQAGKLCQAMKDRGVVIFTIAFNAATLPAAQTLMQNCATSSSHYFNAEDSAALLAAYANIASRFQGVGLTE